MTVRFRSRLRVYSASATGPLHVQEGLPNQDAFACYHDPGLAVLAVADGVGSCRHSDRGSLSAARRLVVQLSSLLLDLERPETPGLWATRLNLCLDRWRAWCRDGLLLEHATTLLAVALAPDLLVAAQVGDGAIWARSADGVVGRLVHAERAGFLSHTRAVHRDPFGEGDLLVVHPFHTEGRLSAVFLATDGVADDVARPETFVNDLASRLETTWRGCGGRALDQALADWPTSGHSDDKTLVGLVFEP